MSARAIHGLLTTLASIGLAGAAAAQQTAQYSVTFDATWSATTHPVGFPGNPHFSPLIGGTHTAAVTFWEPGQLASHGIEVMAETGDGNPLAEEVLVAVGAGTASGVVFGLESPASPGSTGTTFTADRDFPLVTLVTMVAPSPDWFVGVRDLALHQNGEWIDQQVVTLFAYDSGTDSGTGHASPNQDTQPPEPIALISTLPLGNGTPLGTFTFVRTDAPLPVPLLGPFASIVLAAALAGIGGRAFERGRLWTRSPS